MSYQAEEMDLRTFFHQNYQYTIPRYQRNYVWTEKEWEILIEDIFYAVKNHQKHFLGSFISKKSNSSSNGYKRELIDGQQRLITLNVILFSLIYLLKVYSEKFSSSRIGDRIEVLSDFICFKDEQSVEEVLKLNLENDEYLKLSELSLRDNNIEIYDAFFKKKDTISIVFTYFVEKFRKLLFENENNLDLFINFQKTLLDIKIISITADNYLEANTLFEIVNARGIPLKTMELLKNYLLIFSDDYKILDVENNNWNEMLGNLSDANIDCDIYLHHFMQMYYNYTGTKDKMYSFIKETEKASSDENKRNLFACLVNYHKLYIDISQNYSNIRLYEYILLKKIRLLFPLVLSLEIQFKRNILSKKNYNHYLEMILCFMIGFNLNKSTTNNINPYIIEYSHNIYLANNFSTVEKEFYSFMKKISKYYPSNKKMKELIKEIRYSNKNKTAKNINSSVLKFLLQPRYLEITKGEDWLDYNFDKMNVEHILPDDMVNENTWKIGNLLLLSKKFNNKLKNADYSVKRKKLLSYNEPYARNFAEKNEVFTEEKILRETKILNDYIFKTYNFDVNEIDQMNNKILNQKYISFIQKNEKAQEVYYTKGIESLIQMFDNMEECQELKLEGALQE